MSRTPRIKFHCDNPNCPIPDKTFTENITGVAKRKKNLFNYCSNRCKNADKSRATKEHNRIKSSTTGNREQTEGTGEVA
jgi:endogenous inhibitor of DNA gyrase (YacG/DUF329 family)